MITVLGMNDESFKAYKEKKSLWFYKLGLIKAEDYFHLLSNSNATRAMEGLREIYQDRAIREAFYWRGILLEW